MEEGSSTLHPGTQVSTRGFALSWHYSTDVLNVNNKVKSIGARERQLIKRISDWFFSSRIKPGTWENA